MSIVCMKVALWCGGWRWCRACLAELRLTSLGRTCVSRMRSPSLVVIPFPLSAIMAMVATIRVITFMVRAHATGICAGIKLNCEAIVVVRPESVHGASWKGSQLLALVGTHFWSFAKCATAPSLKTVFGSGRRHARPLTWHRRHFGLPSSPGLKEREQPCQQLHM